MSTATIVPPFKTAVSERKNMFFIQVQLLRVPANAIEVEVLSSKIRVETPKWTKHFSLV